MTEPARRPAPTAAADLKKLASFRAKIDAQREKAAQAAVLDQLEQEYARRRDEAAQERGIAPADVDERVRRRLAGLPEEEEFVPEDDAVIGQAFRRSLVVLAAVAALVAVVLLLLHRAEAPPPETALAAAAPVAPQVEVTPPDLPFTDVTAAAGIAFTHQNGAYGDKLLPETMGGGGAFLDYDRDGDPDLLFVNGGHWPHHDYGGRPAPRMALYANDGAGRFRDVTEAAGLAVSFYGQGVAVGDADGDGWVDVFFTAVGPNRFFRNRGGRFEEATAAAGLGGGRDEWSTAATFLDVDVDGDLDLFWTRYVKWSKEIDFQVDYRLVGVGRAYGPPNNYEGTYPSLYLNDGTGKFTDASAAWGVQVDNPVTGRAAGKGLGVVPVDVDRDGFLDLLVANDTVGKFFFKNEGGQRFREMGAAYGLAYDRVGAATGSMGVDAGNFRNDADLGIVIGNFANEMTTLYVSQGTPDLFADESIVEGIGAPSRTALTFGLFLFDADLDGRLDLLQVNGHLEEEIGKVDPSQSYRQSAQLFWNAGPAARQTFAQVPATATGDLARPIVGRGSAFADVDGDGDLDVVLMQTGGPAVLLRNDQATGHHWLRVRLTGDPAQTSNRDALGARVAVTAGGVTQERQVMPTKSYLSQSELTLTFGLGTATAVDALEVTWPGGGTQKVEVPRVDQTIEVVQGG